MPNLPIAPQRGPLTLPPRRAAAPIPLPPRRGPAPLPLRPAPVPLTLPPPRPAPVPLPVASRGPRKKSPKSLKSPACKKSPSPEPLSNQEKEAIMKHATKEVDALKQQARMEENIRATARLASGRFTALPSTERALLDRALEQHRERHAGSPPGALSREDQQEIGGARKRKKSRKSRNSRKSRKQRKSRKSRRQKKSRKGKSCNCMRSSRRKRRVR